MKCLYLKPHHMAAGLVELHADQVNGFNVRAILVRVAITLISLQRLAFGCELRHLELR